MFFKRKKEVKKMESNSFEEFYHSIIPKEMDIKFVKLSQLLEMYLFLATQMEKQNELLNQNSDKILDSKKNYQVNIQSEEKYHEEEQEIYQKVKNYILTHPNMTLKDWKILQNSVMEGRKKSEMCFHIRMNEDMIETYQVNHLEMLQNANQLLEKYRFELREVIERIKKVLNELDKEEITIPILNHSSEITYIKMRINHFQKMKMLCVKIVEAYHNRSLLIFKLNADEKLVDQESFNRIREKKGYNLFDN